MRRETWRVGALTAIVGLAECVLPGTSAGCGGVQGASNDDAGVSSSIPSSSSTSAGTGATSSASSTSSTSTIPSTSTSSTSTIASASSTSASDAGAADSGAAGDATVAAGCGAAGASLVVNGSFESPVVPVGTYQLFDNGGDVSGWSVVGATGSVAVIGANFLDAPANAFTFPAEDGAQSIDLTGNSNTATGVAQTLATTAGTTYCVSFWIGNVVAPNLGYGSSSTVNVTVNGVPLISAVNSEGAGTTTVSWEQFSASFMATGASTIVAFINGDPPNDTANLLDDVAVR